jgi:LysM repeat protein
MLILLLMLFINPPGVRADRLAPAPLQSSAADVIAGVNALRASRGLAPFQTNSILMSVCQAQSDYMASIGTFSDTDAQGRGSGARALAAGYPLAGDLSQGGLISENVFWGNHATAQDAIGFWQSDAIHRIALFDPTFQDVGAGVSVVGSAYYYCQIAALPTNGRVAQSTPNPQAPRALAAVPLVISTPNPDGSIIHVIQPGDTLLAIAHGYGISLDALEHLNNLTATTTIYPGHKLTIRPAYSPTPAHASPTPLSITPTQILVMLPTGTSTGADASSLPGGHAPNAGLAVAIIAVAALLFAGAITAIGARNRV